MKLQPTKDAKGYYFGEYVPGKRVVRLVNPGDSDWTKHKFVLQFGAYGDVTLCAHANSLDDALDGCIDWIAEHMPGLLADDAVREAYAEAIAEGKSEDEARDFAETDVTIGGNCGHYLHSWEWGIVAEDPTREELFNFIHSA